ncbi:MAG: LysR family transcriptional regulator [Mariprofundaceae bacterium]|nr:LysR family transcriptional regulator [Mariprofundaceae bacterium]
MIVSISFPFGDSAMHLTLKQLQIFEAVAKHRNYTQAAKALFLTQPAVSMQIKQLEEQAGLALFERSGKQTHLTEAGRELLRYSHNIHQQLEEASRVLDELRGVQRGHLHLTMASTANYFAPRLLAAFCERFPTVQVSLDVANRDGLLKSLEDNTTDIVIMGKPPAGMSVNYEVFMENPLVVIAPPAHPLSKRRHIPLAELTEHPFIVRERGSGTRAAVERFLAQHNIERPGGMEMNSSEAIKQAVQAGLGLGVVSLHTLEMELTLKRLDMLDVKDFPIMRHWRIVYRKDKRFSAVAQAFHDFVISEAGQILKIPEKRSD